MEITSFILGVCAVIVLMMVVGTFVNYLTTSSLKKEINSLYRDIENLERNLSIQIEKVDEARGKQHFEHINYADTLNNNVHDEMNKLYGYVDSRNDKLKDGVSQQIADIYRQLDKLENEGKSVING
jgi:predicted PurR-regulated permease PerM